MREEYKRLITIVEDENSDNDMDEPNMPINEQFITTQPLVLSNITPITEPERDLEPRHASVPQGTFQENLDLPTSPMSPPFIDHFLEDLPIDEPIFSNQDDETQHPLSPIIRSTIPLFQVKVVKKRSAKVVKKKNKFEGLDWEELNTTLHGLYPSRKPGVLCLENFDLVNATEDVELLTLINNKNIPELFLIKQWIKKIAYAASLTPRDSDYESDSFDV